MIENVEQTIRDYLPNIIHMSLATCKDNKPWVSELHFAYDNDLNLYFRSKTTTRHCQEIAENKFVSGNIVTQHQDSDKPRGVYFEGTCEVALDGEILESAISEYSDRFGVGRESMEAESKETGHKFYKITVENYYVFDARESKPPHKYKLEWKK